MKEKQKPALKLDSLREEYEKTVEMIYGEIQKKCIQPGETAKEIYLLSLALKNLTQSEPTKQ